MNKLKFLDETLRDGQQALWATRMKTESMLPIAPVMAAAGYYQICPMAPVSFETSAMYLFEDPFDRLRLLRQYIPGVQFDFLVRSRNLCGWRRHTDDTVELFLKTLHRYGIGSIKVFDGLNDFRLVQHHFNVGKKLGMQVKSMVSFCVSPVHTDDYIERKTRELVERGVDGVIQSDPAGVMPPERTRTIIPRVRKVLEGKELQFSCHATTGLANECYRQAIRHGVDTVWTCARPLSYGSAFPAAIDILQIAREEGRATDLDEAKIREIDDWFYWVAYQEQKPIKQPVQFDPVHYEKYAAHQIPSGMLSNMARQLADLGLEHRLEDVLEETGRVRAELGYPVMVTPYSQYVGVQATINVIEGRRYNTVPEDIRLYARGYYGEPIAPLDPNVKDILSQGQPDLDPLAELSEPTLPKVRAEHGPFATDEDLLMFMFLNPAALNNFKKFKKEITWDPRRVPLAVLIQELSKRGHLKSISLERGGLKFHQVLK